MHLRTALLVLSMITAGCNAPPASRNEKTEPTGSASAALAAPGLHEPTVAWPGVSSIDDRARAALPAEALRLVSLATMPVLVLPAKPDASAPLAGTVMVVEDQFYTLSGRTPEGATVHLQGTRGQHRYEDIAPVAGRVRLHGDALGFVTENEGIRVASWMENGIAYAVDLECRSPDDAACASDDAVVTIARSLVFVGGRGAR